METDLNKELLLNQLVKLGDMMGDGLHHEPDGKWISQEYKKVSKLLFPEMFKDQRKKQAEIIDKQISILIEEEKCPCGGKLMQKRKGTKIVYCQECDKRYKMITKKKEDGKI